MLTVKDHVLLPVIASIAEHDFIKIAKGTYERMGITVLGNFDGILQWVKLPEGWHLGETEQVYDVLLDAEHTVRGKVYYETNDNGDITHAIFKEVK